MSRVKGRNTVPELLVRSLIHRMGFRFRLHRKDLPGKPDIVFPSQKKAIFVHGCFWHRHRGCKYATDPKTRKRYWHEKFEANVARDDRTVRRLRAAGWRVMVVWQCETKEPERLLNRLAGFLAKEMRNG